MSEAHVYKVTAATAAGAWINNKKYQEMYEHSVKDPDGPGATKLKPGSATRPFFGVVPAIVDGGSAAELR